MRDLARRLLAASRTASDPHVHDVLSVSEKLRISLTKFVGAEGFASLMRRALVLAGEDVPSLQTVKIGDDGRLQGLERPGADPDIEEGGSEAAVVLAAHLLGLLAIFIGESLAMRLVDDAWPDPSPDE